MRAAAIAILLIAACTPALPSDGQRATVPGEQFIPIFTGREIPGPAGSVTPAGLIDYLELLNRRDGGVNGVRLTWAECETGFDDARGVACFEQAAARGAALVLPLSSGISYALTERSRSLRIPMLMFGYGRADASDGRAFPYAFPIITNLLSQASAQIRFIGQLEGGMHRLHGKRITYLYLDVATGREAIGLLQLLAEQHGFELATIGVPIPGVDQQPYWERIRSDEPDWVLLAAPGPMTPAALQAAARVGFSAERIVGFGLSGSDHDVLPAGLAARGYIAVALNPSGMNFPVVREIVRHVYQDQGPVRVLDRQIVGSASYNRGVIQGILVAEAMRIAQAEYGARPLTGEELRFGIERLALDDARLAQLGALQLLPPLSISCADHEGGGAVKFQQWLGRRWNVISDWIAADAATVRLVVERAAQRYVALSGLQLRGCGDD
jgi:branched-chain amino acid transport system substrate-binding protein